MLQLDQGGLRQAREFSRSPLRQPTRLPKFDEPGPKRTGLGAALNSSIESNQSLEQGRHCPFRPLQVHDRLQVETCRGCQPDLREPTQAAQGAELVANSQDRTVK